MIKRLIKLTDLYDFYTTEERFIDLHDEDYDICKFIFESNDRSIESEEYITIWNKVIAKAEKNIQ